MQLYAESVVSLHVSMAELFVQAAEDLRGEIAGALHYRFLGWIKDARAEVAPRQADVR